MHINLTAKRPQAIHWIERSHPNCRPEPVTTRKFHNDLNFTIMDTMASFAWPLHKDDMLFQSGRPMGLNIYFAFSLIHRERGSTRDSGADGQRGKDRTDQNRSGKDREEQKPATKRVGQKPREVVSPSGLKVRTTSQMQKPTNPKPYWDMKVIRLTCPEYRRWSLMRRYLGRDDSEWLIWPPGWSQRVVSRRHGIRCWGSETGAHSESRDGEKHEADRDQKPLRTGQMDKWAAQVGGSYGQRAKV